MRLLVATLVVLAVLLPAAFTIRRLQRERASLDPHGLDELRRVYRRDNPRGPGLEPMIHDLQPKSIEVHPKDET